MILVDTNVPMYLVGDDEKHKARTERLLDHAVTNRERLVTDAEVFQEILHRYTAINRLEAIQPAFDLLHGIVDEIFPIDVSAIESAKTLVLGYRHLSARFRGCGDWESEVNCLERSSAAPPPPGGAVASRTRPLRADNCRRA